MSDGREDRIRARAHQLWEEDGRPEGRADVHWEKASELVAIEESQESATVPVGESVAAAEAAEPLIALENEGEFPTLTDQGEQRVPHAPGAKAKPPLSAQRRSFGR